MSNKQHVSPLKPGATATVSGGTSTTQTLEALATFAGAMVRTQDLDPLYPILRRLNEQDGHEPGSDEAMKRSVVYTAFYNIAAAECVVEAAKHDKSAVVARQLAGRAGTERRGLRTPDFMVFHLNSIGIRARDAGGFTPWLQQHWTEESTPKERWELATEVLLAVPYNGRWAAYKTCDILAEVHGWPMEAPDAGHRFSSGPREGLLLLQAQTGHTFLPDLPEHNDQSQGAIERLDRATETVQHELWRRDVPMKMSEVETILCNWKALVSGRYYIGHDVDEMLGQVLSLPQTGEYASVRSRLLKARRATFMPELLGEQLGWIGVRKELMGTYAWTGELVNAELGR